MFKNFFSKLSKKVGIDLGTSKTILSIQDKGIVMKEPSIVAINNKTDQILAVGEDAQKMIGKNPRFITLAYPLVNGIISDFEVTEKFLKYFIDKLFMENINLTGRPSVVIGIPLDVTEVEKKAVEDASLSAGAGKVYLVEEIMAAAIGARLPIQDASGSMIVNLGGGKTEIAVISLNGVVNWRTVNGAGKELDNDIVQYARGHFNLLIGQRIAENIKIKIGSAFELNEELKMEMRGRDLISGLPREIIVTDYQIRDAISKSVLTLIDHIKATLETTPPELVADIYERGIVLTGGGAQLKGLDQAIAKAAEVPVRVADDPATSTIRGLTTLLDDDSLLKEILLPSANEEKMVR
ncbi:rod shape-determining protein [Candidatus Falkowbacteria bacterium CG10_big_fil_rev_8_21_14_0_10_39_11]|uniref:Cell shape-determining protein MreB n=1 Tax=Candidatus Falkowbacteria bacterium CG10_big_fil_rev_8_21_14_0_10_39_11 TaxID=1974565 RepID=A0A2H0V4L0_9BACT|nr:MAG: rod shape-determining protein [Candidatus Falkowbacteria bacterium CG10_big_fil_rev_8_21_14_0_10_39_11]